MTTIHNVKQIIIGGFIAGGVALAAMGLGTGVAGAAGDGSVRVSDQAEHATGDGSVRVGHPNTKPVTARFASAPWRTPVTARFAQRTSR